MIVKRVVISATAELVFEATVALALSPVVIAATGGASVGNISFVAPRVAISASAELIFSTSASLTLKPIVITATSGSTPSDGSTDVETLEGYFSLPSPTITVVNPVFFGFRLLVPTVPHATTPTSNYSTVDKYGPLNTIGGAYSDTKKNASAGTLSDVRYSMTSNRLVNYVVVSNVRGLIDSDSDDQVSIRVYNTNDSTFQAFTVGLNDLVGARQNEFVSEVTEKTVNYYRVQAISNASYRHEVGKVFLGEYFDFGRDPTEIIIENAKQDSNIKRRTREIRVQVEGVSPAKKTQFVKEIVPYCAKTPIFLWDKNDALFGGDVLIYARLASYKCTVNSRDVWRVEMNFIEAV